MRGMSELDTQAGVVSVSRDLLRRVAMSMEKVHERMLRTTEALEKGGVPFAVIGGNAVAIWVESVDAGAGRSTKDVDIVLRRANLQQAIDVMAAAGFDFEEVNGVSMFLEREDPMPSRGVHLLFVGEKVRPDNKHPVPDFLNIKRSPEGVPAVGLHELLILKLQSYRRRDQVHVEDMLHVGLIDDEQANRLPPDLRERLDAIRENPDDPL